MKMRNLQKYIKRVLALALCAGCLIGVCSQSTLAADAVAVQLKYLNNKYGVGDKPEDVMYAAGILSEGSLQVQMTLSGYNLLGGTDALADNYVNALNNNGAPMAGFDKDNKPYTFSVGTTGGNGSTYTVTAKLNDGVGQAQLQIVGNTASLNPERGRYNGNVYAKRSSTTGTSGGGQASLAYMDAQATGNAQVVLSETSNLVIRCVQGQTPVNTVPEFVIVNDQLTGMFKDYENADISVLTGKDDKGNPYMVPEKDAVNAPGRQLTILVQPQDSTKPTLTLRFNAPGYYNDIPDYSQGLNTDGTPKSGLYLNELGGTYRKDQQNVDPTAADYNPNWRTQVYNNYIRGGYTYTLSFSPPQSTSLSLLVATPEYVAKQLLDNIRTNQGASSPGAGGVNGQFITWVGEDKPGLIANNEFTLKCRDDRYNASFYIYWHWEPDDPSIAGAADAIKINQENTSTEITARVYRLEEDVKGKLYARIVCEPKPGSYIPLLTAGSTPFPDKDGKMVDGYQLIYDAVTVRGSGVPATTYLMSSTTGATPNRETGEMPATDEVKDDYEHTNPKTGAKEKGELLPAQLPTMDVFQGRVRGYYAAPVGPYQHLLRMNMGMKNAASSFAVVTVDTPGIVELRTRQGNGEELYFPREASDIYVPQRGYTENDFRRDDHRIDNTDKGSAAEPTMGLVVTAMAKGETQLTVQYFVQIGSYFYVDSTYTTTIKVQDTRPSEDATLSDLIVRSASGNKESYPYGFKPDVTEYNTIIDLPYAYKNYELSPLINEPKCQHLQTEVTARDINGNDVTETLFAGATFKTDENGKVVAALVGHGGSLPITITDDNIASVYSINVHVTAQNPEKFEDYRLQIRRLPPSEDDRLATLVFYDEKDKDCTNNLLPNFDPEIREYVMDVAYGAKRLKVELLQSFPRALVQCEPELEPLNPSSLTAQWETKEYLNLDDIKEIKEGVPGYGELSYFIIRVMPEIMLDENGKKPDSVRWEDQREYKIYIHRLPPSDNSRLAASNGITVINSAELGNNPRSLPFSPTYSAFTRQYFMTGKQAVPFSTKEVRFKIIPADNTATVYIYNVSEVGEPIVTPTPEPTATPDPNATATPDPNETATPDPNATATPEPTATPESAATPTPTPTPVPPNKCPTCGKDGTLDTDTNQYSCENEHTWPAPSGEATTQSLHPNGTLAGAGVAPLFGFGRAASGSRPTRDHPMVLTTFNEFTDPIALEARREDGSFGTNEMHILVVAEAGANIPIDKIIAVAEGEGGTMDASERESIEKVFTLYRLEIERLPASTDADLTNVVVRDINGKEQKLFNFHKDETSYSFTVPYEAEKVDFTPFLSYPAGATVQLKDSGNPVHMAGFLFDNLASGVSSRLYDLNDWRGEPRTFTLVVKSEAFNDSNESESVKWAKGLAKEYTFTIRRGAPSTDARLRRLEVSGITDDGISPVFKASQLNYTAVVQPGGNSQVTITPTVNEPHATIMWWEAGDEKGAQTVQSGTATDPIELVEEHTVIFVEVTAQDGTTKQRYSIDFYNPNVVDLTDNADLASLKVERGVMTPEFDPAVITYEVAVKEDTYAVNIIPKPADPLATVQVFEGTREMGDYNNNYSLALKDGANVVTVRVTSPDGTRTNNYTVTIYRNDAEHQKTLKPLTAEDLGEEIFKDPSVNPIIISVVEYPRIQSDVFQALKDATVDDPDKTLVLQGNDFSLTFRGADLDTIIPTREIYDFSMSFSSPDEDKINALVGGYDLNVDILGEVVMIYFDYHGDLPGVATLHINVGNKYASQPLFWHYYNRERDRIDYYGTVQSNSQGTFAVLIDHFSTYLVTRYHRIEGSEDRSGSVSLNVGSLGVGGKINPQTAVRPNRAWEAQ